ncbi:MAG: DUF3179 domain-containing protein [Gammaproteobacteria bacterium]|nr:DUF3179 domain-containing protein [Gammaproteobacteria bacterium]
MLMLLSLVWMAAATAVTKNGFQLQPGLLKPAQIRSGGPPKDGIPAINRPQFVRANDVDFLAPEDRVLGLDLDGVPRAYAVKILDWHEVVNDWTRPSRVVVTYCPLCGSGMAFRVDDDRFGVSGLLYNSDVLLYDLATESLWSQILGKAVTGDRMGTELTQVPLVHTSWKQWVKRHPGTWALSTDTGYRSATNSSDGGYRRSAQYVAYERSRSLWQPVAHRDRRFHPKEWVLGLELAGVFKAYPFSVLDEAQTPLLDLVAGRQVKIHFDDNTAWAEDRDGALLPAVRMFWFAWYAFHPDTSVYVRERQTP